MLIGFKRCSIQACIAFEVEGFVCWGLREWLLDTLEVVRVGAAAAWAAAGVGSFGDETGQPVAAWSGRGVSARWGLGSFNAEDRL